MAQEERLATIVNTSDEPITDMWDGKEYTFEPGKEVTLVYGLGLTFRDRHPEITLVGERYGLAPDVLYVEEKLVNVGEADLTLTWDGRLYDFPVGKAVGIDRSLAPTMIVQARANGGVLKYEAELADGEVKAVLKAKKERDEAAEETTATAKAEAAAIGQPAKKSKKAKSEPEA